MNILYESENPDGKHYLDDLVEDGRIILKLMFIGNCIYLIHFRKIQRVSVKTLMIIWVAYKIRGFLTN